MEHEEAEEWVHEEMDPSLALEVEAEACGG